MLLNEGQAERVFANSYEERIRALACVCEEKGWSLVSSSEDSAYVIEVDGRLSKRGYKVVEGDYVWGRAYYLQTLPESDAVGLVARSLKKTAKAIFENDLTTLTPEALKQMSLHAKGYMSFDSAMNALSGGELSEFYDENRSEIRRSCHGRLGEIEAQNKLTHYSRMSAERQQGRLAEIKDALSTCAESLDRLECRGCGHVNGLITQFKETAINASAIIKHSDRAPSELAVAVDSFSKSLLTANILRDYAVHKEGK